MCVADKKLNRCSAPCALIFSTIGLVFLQSAELRADNGCEEASVVLCSDSYGIAELSRAEKNLLRSFLYHQDGDDTYAKVLLSRIRDTDVDIFLDTDKLIYYTLSSLFSLEEGNKESAIVNLENCVSFANTGIDENELSQLISNCYLERAKLEIVNDMTEQNLHEATRYLEIASNRGNSEASRLLASISVSERNNPPKADYYNTCLGMTSFPSNCFSVNDPDLQNLCLANSNQDYEINCYSIDNNDLKNLCLAMAYPNNETNCYSINNTDIKNTCLAASPYQYTMNCYEIPSGPWRSMCGGLALSPQNCYNLD